MTESEFATKAKAQTMRNEILDLENDITSFVEGMRISRDRLARLKKDLHALEHPGEEFKDDDLF